MSATIDTETNTNAHTAAGGDGTGLSGVTRPKDLGALAIIFGFAGMAWFGWAHAGQVAGTALTVGMALGAVAGIVAITRMRRLPGVATMSVDPVARRTYNLACLAEVLLIAIGGFALVRGGHADMVPAWAMAVMGAHFVPLARVFAMPFLYAIAAACLIGAALAVAAGLLAVAPTPTVAGSLAGLLLVGTSMAATIRLRRAR